MNCPLCEAPVFENIGELATKYEGVWYHSDCLLDEMGEIRPEAEETLPAGTDWPSDEAHRMAEAQELKR